MSRSLATATIVGTLGKDPETRSTSSGKKIVSFSLATEDGFGDKATTSWWNISAWGDQAEFAEKYLKKGKTVAVSGKLSQRSWEDKTGAKRTVTEINAKDISFFDVGERAGGSGSRSATPQTREQAAPVARAAPADDIFGDEPF